MAALQQGRWRAALEELSHAEELVRDRCTGMQWELVSAQVHRLFCLSITGDLAELALRGRRYLREAEDRGDLFASTLMRLMPLVGVWLAANDPQGGRQDCERALAQWSHEGFHLQHFYGMTALAQFALYSGDGAGGFRIFERNQPAVEQSLLLHFQIIRLSIYELRARCLLAWAGTSTGTARKELLGRLDAEIGRIEHERMPWSNATALLLRAGMAILRDRPERALPLYERAEQGFAETEMNIYCVCARLRRGEILGGEVGRALVDEAEAWLRAHTVQDPRRVALLIAPAHFGM
jgi:hypothetical protein